MNMSPTALEKIDWETWLHAPGMPPVKNAYDSTLSTAAYDLASAWHTADVMGIGAEPPASANADNLKGWGTAQVIVWLCGWMFVMWEGWLAIIVGMVQQLEVGVGFELAESSGV